jgi:WXXGXW repeat (2 copies)
MLRKGLIAGFFAAMLSVNVFAADVVVRVAPPRAVVETRVPAPGPGYVWTPGYQRWDGHAYAWQAGAWVKPPHPHAHWVAHRWVHRHGGWEMEEGHWR